jgi:hypothetical protein
VLRTRVQQSDSLLHGRILAALALQVSHRIFERRGEARRYAERFPGRFDRRLHVPLKAGWVPPA